MNPTNDWTSVTFLGVGQSWMPATFWVHLHATFQEDEAEVLDCGLLKGALLHFEVDMVFMEDVGDSYYNPMMLFFGLAAKDEDVVHVYDYDSLIYELSEDVVHHHLECH